MKRYYALLAAITLGLSLSLASHVGFAKTESKPSTHAPVKATTAKSGEAKTASSPTYKGAPVLDPGQFSGEAMMGYASAKNAPEVCSHLFCYCGCDVNENHSALIDCFTGMHGVDCHICQEEAVMALRLKRDGTPLAEIQKQIDQQFGHHYPFKEETAVLKRYKQGRLWHEPGDEAIANDAKNKMATTPKLKPGFTAGDCCKADHSK